MYILVTEFIWIQAKAWVQFLGFSRPTNQKSSHNLKQPFSLYLNNLLLCYGNVRGMWNPPGCRQMCFLTTKVGLASQSDSQYDTDQINAHDNWYNGNTIILTLTICWIDQCFCVEGKLTKETKSRNYIYILRCGVNQCGRF